ncbi:MAG: hypothetical protein PHU46_13580 [Rhodocyclaceae bacterium]|nr:hypothetical protein [Rhodocyclaceae bacterium]
MGEWRLEQARIQSLTTAWLDAVLKQDSVAREWLSQDARRWLDGAAELYFK